MEPTKEKSEQYLKCTFTESEKTEMAEKMSIAFQKKAEAEVRLKEVSTQIKAEIAGEDSIIQESAKKYNQGFEYRNVKCTVERDFERGKYRVTRDDTGEVIEDRLLTEKELQLQMVHS